MEINVTDINFQKEVIKKSSETPVLVDFWASWCGPCMMLGPTLEKIAKEYDGKLIVAKAATDENADAASKFGVMSIPAVKLFKDGKVIDEFVGAQPEATIKQWLDQKL
ncbi:thioredoxin [archaeon]|jgi:thioredoxin|nr:thioredoxin [archaeon]MBT7128774.1 thioredoxin [archaeon]